jgi:hypothetical protein
MRMKKTLAAASVLAIAFALASLPEVQAASVTNPGPAIHAGSLAQVVKAKKHRHARMHMHKHAGRMARSKRPGSCGENMYFSRKAHHCLDARDKA